MKNILLVEPAYNNPYPPLGLMKISTWHKRQGDNVLFIPDFVHNKKKDDFMKTEKCYKTFQNHYDIIYITSLFTYNAFCVINSIEYYKNKFPDAQIKVGGIMATLLPNHIEKKTEVVPHIGLLEGAEDCPPDYSLRPDLDYSISFTTRGCTRKCRFCAVRKHEPDFIVKENWPEDIDVTKRKIIFWDNNWLASPNFEKDIDILLNFINNAGITQIDFNQGLDCRLLNEQKIKLLSKLNIKPLRLAFDNHSEDTHIQEAIQLAQKYGFNDIRVYVLYNSEDNNDTPEYFYYRLDEINRLGALSYPMRFRPIDNLNGQYISDKWDKKLLRAIKLSLMFYYSKGMVRKNREAFKQIYGQSPEEFKNKLYEIFKKDRIREKEAKKKRSDSIYSLELFK